MGRVSDSERVLDGLRYSVAATAGESPMASSRRLARRSMRPAQVSTMSRLSSSWLHEAM